MAPVITRAWGPSLAVMAAVVGLGACASSGEHGGEAATVEILDSVRTADCRELGRERIRVETTFLLMSRDRQAILVDLQRRARRKAAQDGGDAVTALSVPREGSQLYGFYDCVDEVGAAAGGDRRAWLARSG